MPGEPVKSSEWKAIFQHPQILFRRRSTIKLMYIRVIHCSAHLHFWIALMREQGLPGGLLQASGNRLARSRSSAPRRRSR